MDEANMSKVAEGVLPEGLASRLEEEGSSGKEDSQVDRCVRPFENKYTEVLVKKRTLVDDFKG